MELVNLPQKWVDHLVALPESGMGYQRVDVTFDDGSIVKECIVLNSEELNVPSSYTNKIISDIKMSK